VVEGAFSAALAGTTSGPLESLMDLDTALEPACVREDSPDLDGDRALYRSLIVRLGEARRRRPRSAPRRCRHRRYPAELDVARAPARLAVSPI